MTVLMIDTIPPQQVEVLLPVNVDHGFDYLVPEGMELHPGSYVKVPFGRGTEIGVVWGAASGGVAPGKCKPVTQAFDDIPPMPEALRDCLAWVSRYTLASLGNALKLAMPVEKVFTTASRKKASHPILTPHPNLLPDGEKELHCDTGSVELPLPIGERAGVRGKILTPEQQRAAEQLKEHTAAGFSVTLLEGITGSGKTEVYFDSVARALDAGKQALVLLPEIALSVQWVERFGARFGFAPIVWHSSISVAERKRAWRDIAQGTAKLVVGARSALFLPYPKLGLIVVDEEHDGSYKQEDGVIYQARDMAVARAQHEKFPIVLVSATPSLETLVNVEMKKYRQVHLASRFGGAALPTTELLDMRKEGLRATEWLSAPLKESVTAALAAGQQALLFLNRRGYAPLMLCRACGHRFECPSCSAWLVMHKQAKRLECHHCGYVESMPNACPTCKAEGKIAPCGPGVERIEEEVVGAFPQARVLTLASDTVRSQAEMEASIRRIEAQEVDIVIGTQLLAKGHHFPGLALVGVLDADLGLQGGDLRATEKTWQLLHQLSGRAGREQVPGRVLIQTYQPEHPVMQALKEGNGEKLMGIEKALRQQTGLPPYGRLVAIIVEGKNEEKARAFAKTLAAAAPAAEGIRVLGPAPAPIYKLRDFYRYRLLVKAAKNLNIQHYITTWLAAVPIPSTLKCKIDVDPYSFL